MKKNTSTLIAPEMAESEKRERAKSRLLLCRLSDVLASVVFKVPTYIETVGWQFLNTTLQRGKVLHRECGIA